MKTKGGLAVERHQQLAVLLESLGASFVGFSNVAGKTDDRLKAYNYAVTIGVRLSDAIIDEISDKPTYTYFHHYRTVNALLDQIALRGLLFIQQQGFRAFAVLRRRRSTMWTFHTAAFSSTKQRQSLQGSAAWAKTDSFCTMNTDRESGWRQS